jgi:hypothetical protein
MSEATGAQLVADAVKRVADAAVAEIQKAPKAPGGDFVVSGSAGGKFTIRGTGLGTNGVVKLNGVQLATQEWGSTFIQGTLPADARAGELVVHVDDKTTKRGRFNG